uniref:Uncharacterized protein n=1 Tax=Amphimedon queenslandica TaxID=400682 RepID=A0A1X7US51_AMPQE
MLFPKASLFIRVYRESIMITSRATKSSETSKFQNKCMFIWLMVLSVLLIAVLAALIAIGFKLYKTNCTCNNEADKVAVGKRSNNNTAAFVPPVQGILPSYLNWTSLSTSNTNINTASPGTVSQINLSAIGVPQDATEVFVYAVGATGSSYPNDAVGEIEVYSHVSMKQYVHMHSYNSNDWSYNSDNLWVPIGKNRILCGKYVGPAINGNRYARIKVIGYR